MPELPEVEIVRTGLEQAISGRKVREVIIRRNRLRLPLPADLASRLHGRRISAVARRGKYLLLTAAPETCIIHLGMSGVLSMSSLPPSEKHAHVGFALDNGQYLIYTDPRRFGLILLADGEPLQHRLLASIGCEPLSRTFNGALLHKLLAGKKSPIKTALMDSRLLAGVGNIYAAESLFYAGIHPCTTAGALSPQQCKQLAQHIKKVLRRAITAGGSTLRDFSAADGKPGYFQTRWAVYGRAGVECINRCGATIQQLRQSGRSSYYCPNCQPPPEVTGHGR